MTDQFYNQPDDAEGYGASGSFQNARLNQGAVDQWGGSEGIEAGEDPTWGQSTRNAITPYIGDNMNLILDHVVGWDNAAGKSDWIQRSNAGYDYWGDQTLNDPAPEGSLPAQAGFNDIGSSYQQPLQADTGSGGTDMASADGYAKGGKVEPWTRPAARPVHDHPHLPGVTVDRTQSVPEGSHVSMDGKRIFLDKKLPRIAMVKGKPLDPAYPHAVHAYIRHHLGNDEEFSKKFPGKHEAVANDFEHFWLQHHGYDPDTYNKMFKRQAGLVAGGEAPSLEEGGDPGDEPEQEEADDELPENAQPTSGEANEDVTGSVSQPAAPASAGPMFSDLIAGGGKAEKKKVGLLDAIKQALVRSAVPAAAGYGGFSAGAAAGIPLAPFAGFAAPAVPIVTGLVGAYFASRAAGELQEPLMDKIGFGAEEYAAARADHPYATLGAEIGANVPFTGVGGAGRVARAIGGGLGLVQEGVQQVREGEFSPGRLGLATAGGAALGAKRNKFNDMFDVAGGVEQLHNMESTSQAIRNRLNKQPGFSDKPATETEAVAKDEANTSVPFSSDNKGVATERQAMIPDPGRFSGGRAFGEDNPGRAEGYDVTRSSTDGSKFTAPQSDIANLRAEAVTKGDPASVFSSTSSKLDREFPPVQNPNEVAPDQAAALIRQSRFRPQVNVEDTMPGQANISPERMDLALNPQPDRPPPPYEPFLRPDEGGERSPIRHADTRTYGPDVFGGKGTPQGSAAFGQRDPNAPNVGRPITPNSEDELTISGNATPPGSRASPPAYPVSAGVGNRTPMNVQDRGLPRAEDAGQLGRRVTTTTEPQDPQRNFVLQGEPTNVPNFEQIGQGRPGPQLEGPPERLGLPAPDNARPSGEPTPPVEPSASAVPSSDKGQAAPVDNERLVSPEQQAKELAGVGAEKPTKVETVTAENLRSPEVRQALMDRGVGPGDAKTMSLYKARKIMAAPEQKTPAIDTHAPQSAGDRLTPEEKASVQKEARNLWTDESGKLDWDKLGQSLKGAVRTFNRWFSPENVSDLAKQAQAWVQEANGLTAMRVFLMEQGIRPYEQLSKNMDDAAKADFWKYVEGRGQGAQLADKRMTPFADFYKKTVNSMAARMKEIDPERFKNLVEDWATHMWEPNAERDALVNKYLGGGKFGSGASLQQRTFPTYADGIAAGLKPKGHPAEQLANYVTSMGTRLEYMNVLKRGLAEGLMKWGKEHGTGGSGTGAGVVEAIPEGWVPLNGPLARDNKGRQLYAPEDFGLVWNRNAGAPTDVHEPWTGTLNKFQRASNFLTQMNLMFPYFHASFVTSEGITTQFGTGISKLLAGDVAGGLKDMAASPLSPLTSVLEGRTLRSSLTDPNNAPSGYAARANILARANAQLFRSKMPVDYATTATHDFYTAFQRGTLGSELRESWANMKNGDVARETFKNLGKAMQTIGHPIFNYYIPLMKAGIASKQLAGWMEMHPNATDAELVAAGRRISKASDGVFGEMVQDNIYWHKTMKQIANQLMFSYSWNLGDIVTFLGGTNSLVRGAMKGENRASMASKEYDPRIGYMMAFPITVAATNAVYQYLKTGEAPQDAHDLIAGRTGGKAQVGGVTVPERVITPGYLKDFFGWSNDPRSELVNKMRPDLKLIHDLFMNKDWRDKPIRDENADFQTQLKQYMDHVLDTMTPIAYKSEVGRKKGTNISPLETAVGLKPAPAQIQAPGPYAAMMKGVHERAWQDKVKADQRAQSRQIYPSGGPMFSDLMR